MKHHRITDYEMDNMLCSNANTKSTIGCTPVHSVK